MAKLEIPPFTHGPIRLRLLDEADLPLTLKWRNQDHIRRWFFYSKIILPEQHTAWFQSYRERDDDFVFIIEEIETGSRPIGQVAIYNIDWQARQGEFGRLMIGETDAVGKGLAKTATIAAIEIAHNQLGISHIYLEVYAHNHPALAIYKKIGFSKIDEEDGIIRMIINNRGE